MSSTQDNNTTQAEQTEQKPQSKWKDPAFVRAYYRNLYQKHRGGYKKHPYVLEDGRRWADVNPFPPEFSSKEEYEEFKKARNRAYKKPPKEIRKQRETYIPLPKKHCDLCVVDVHQGKWEAHLQSIKHNRNVSLLQKFGVAPELKSEETS